MEIICDIEKDLLLKKNHSDAYKQVLINRNQRKSAALDNFLHQNFPNSPLSSLLELQKQANFFQNVLDSSQNKQQAEIDSITGLLQNLQSKIANNEYYLENSPEHQYRIDYDNAVASFVWPTQEELELRQIEKNQLLALLNAN